MGSKTGRRGLSYRNALSIGHGACGAGKSTPINGVFAVRHANRSGRIDPSDGDTVRGDDGAKRDIGLIGKAKGIGDCVSLRCTTTTAAATGRQ